MAFDKAAYIREYYQKNKDRIKEKERIRRAEGRKNNPEIRKKDKEYIAANREHINERTRRWRKKNPEKVKEYNKKIRANRAYCRYYEEVKESRRRKSRPKWITKKQMIEIYDQCPEGYQIDHIIPISNKNVCGLDVPWNIQFLTPEENNFKRNSFDGTYDNESWRERFKKKIE